MTTPFPTTHSTQIPDNALLDISGKQTYLGNTFILPTQPIAFSDQVETPVGLILNPSTSGKSLFFFNKKLATDSTGNGVNIRFYANPTVNVAGSATLPLNLRSGYKTQSISNCYLGATVTANGTLLAALPAVALQTVSSLMNIIDPGDSLLITGQQNTAGTASLFLELAWYEL